MIGKKQNNPLSFFKITNLFTIIILILSTSFLLIKNFHFRDGLISDVHQYIYDTNKYFQFKLPSSIHAAPLFPLTIGLGVLIMPDSIVTTDIVIAINIIASILALVAIILLAKEYDETHFLGLLSILVISMHPLFFMSAIDGSTEPLFYLFTLTMALAIKRERWNKAMWFASLATLVRLDGIVFVMALFFNFFKKKWPRLKKQPIKIINHTPFPFFLLIAILTLIIIHNFINGERYGSFYLFEIVSGIKGHGGQIPNFTFIESLSYNLLINFGGTSVSLPIIRNFYSVILWLFIGYMSFSSSLKDLVGRIINQGLLGYGILHLLFPYYQDRYLSIVIFWIVFFGLQKLLKNSSSNRKIIIFLLTIALSIYNIPLFNQVSYDKLMESKTQHNKNTIVTRWLKNNLSTLEKPVLFIYHQPQLATDYLLPTQKKEVDELFYVEFIKEFIKNGYDGYLKKYETILIAVSSDYLLIRSNYMNDPTNDYLARFKKWLINAPLEELYFSGNNEHYVYIYKLNLKNRF